MSVKALNWGSHFCKSEPWYFTVMLVISRMHNHGFQGDEEKRRGMAVSPYMDRDDPAVAKLQDSFIAHIVSPLAVALNEAGLLPILPGLEEPELIINLKHNHQKWLRELETQMVNEPNAVAQVSTSNQTTTAPLTTTNDVIVEEVSYHFVPFLHICIKSHYGLVTSIRLHPQFSLSSESEPIWIKFGRLIP